VTIASSTVPLAVTTTRLPSCHIGKAYSATLAATGGTPPYSWSTPDAADFPPGITLSPTGTISGTDATQTGRFKFTVTATDASGATASAMLTLSCHGHVLSHGHLHHHHGDDDAQGNENQGNRSGDDQ
jgi:hypothetical protein